MSRAHPDDVMTSLRAEKIIKIMLEEFENHKELLKRAGWIVSVNPYEWWDGLKSADELLISAILVQMTRWELVKKVIERLREKELNSLEKLAELKEEEIGELIKGVNFYKTKAKRIKKLALTIKEIGLDKLVSDEKKLKEIEGIGDETAEALQLFIGNIPILPRSAYLSRVLSRILGINLTKEEAKKLASSVIGNDTYKLKLFHAGIVTLGKTYCLTKPKCEDCLFKDICAYYKSVKNHETF